MRKIARIAEFNFPAQLRAALKPLLSGNLLRFEAAVMPLIKDAMQDYMLDVVELAINTTTLSAKSGDLAQSLLAHTRVTGSNLNTLKGIYRGTIYAPLLEYGGVIRPTHESTSDFPAQLAIPLKDALRPDGTLKLGGPTAWKRFGTFTYVSKRTGQAYLAYRSKTTSRLVLLFLFIPRARILPKLGLRKAHSANLGRLATAVGSVMVQAMSSCDIYGFATGQTNTLTPRGLAAALPNGALRATTLRKSR